MPPKKGKGAYSKPDPIPSGEILIDLVKKQWRLGPSIGTGGFGDIYLASDNISKNVDQKASYVIKVEPMENGPLFCEIAFFIRAAKSEMIEDWKKQHKLDSLGVPCYVGSGSHEFKGKTYRFLVIPRYEKDFHKILQERPDKRFSIKTACAIAVQMMDAYEYLHSKGFVHADLKASNLMLENSSGSKKKQQQVVLLDYGLALKFSDGNGDHTKYAPNPKKAHNGTLEYESRDAHIGAFSRRGDMEVLGFNLLEWLFGNLPWTRDSSPEEVLKKKQKFMKDLNLKKVYPTATEGLNIIEEYLKYVVTLEFEQVPDYSRCRDMFKKGLPKSSKGNLFLEDKTPPAPSTSTKKVATKSKRSDLEDDTDVSPPKRANNNVKTNGVSASSIADLTTGMTPQMMAVQASIKAKALEKEKKTATKRKAPVSVQSVRAGPSVSTSLSPPTATNGRAVTRQQTRK